MRRRQVVIAVLLLIGVFSKMSNAEEVRLTIDIDEEALKYRVRLTAPRGAPENIQYDSLDLKIPAAGLAPRGARAVVKDRADAIIQCGSIQPGYSSYDLMSDQALPSSDFKQLPRSGSVESDWYSISDLLRGFGQCARVADPLEWVALKITFTVRLGPTLRDLAADSPWFGFSPHLRREVSSGT
jgi:hypothetical protein